MVLYATLTGLSCCPGGGLGTQAGFQCPLLSLYSPYLNVLLLSPGHRKVSSGLPSSRLTTMPSLSKGLACAHLPTGSPSKSCQTNVLPIDNWQGQSSLEKVLLMWQWLVIKCGVITSIKGCCLHLLHPNIFWCLEPIENDDCFTTHCDVKSSKQWAPGGWATHKPDSRYWRLRDPNPPASEILLWASNWEPGS